MHRRAVAATVAVALYAGVCPRSVPASIRFEENRGQTDPRVQYLARTAEGMLFLGGDAPEAEIGALRV